MGAFAGFACTKEASGVSTTAFNLLLFLSADFRAVDVIMERPLLRLPAPTNIEVLLDLVMGPFGDSISIPLKSKMSPATKDSPGSDSFLTAALATPTPKSFFRAFNGFLREGAVKAAAEDTLLDEVRVGINVGWLGTMEALGVLRGLVAIFDLFIVTRITAKTVKKDENRAR